MKITCTFLFLLLISWTSTYAQADSTSTNESSTQENAIDFVKVDVKPVFPGCENESKKNQASCFSQKVAEHVAQNFRMSPKTKKKGLHGRVYIQFTVDTSGNIVDVHVIKGVHELLDKDALEAVKSLPKITPGSQEGRKVPVSFVVPINIKG